MHKVDAIWNVSFYARHSLVEENPSGTFDDFFEGINRLDRQSLSDEWFLFLRGPRERPTKRCAINSKRNRLGNNLHAFSAASPRHNLRHTTSLL